MTTPQAPVRIAVTMGDPAGIGPEIIVKACRALRDRIEAGALRLLVIGSGAALERARSVLTPELAFPEVAADDADWPPLCFLQAGPEGAPIPPGVLSTDGGRFAYLAVEHAVRLAQVDEVGRGHQRTAQHHDDGVGHRGIVDGRNEALDPQHGQPRKKQMPGEEATVGAEAVADRQRGEKHREREEEALEGVRAEELEAQRRQEGHGQRQQRAVHRAERGRPGAKPVVPAAAGFGALGRG